MIALALRARDHIQILIERPEEADAQAGEAILAELSALSPSVGAVAPGGTGAGSSAPAAAGASTWRIRLRLPRDVLAHGTNPILLLDELCSLGSATVTPLTEEIPLLQDFDPTACYTAWEVLLTSSEPRQTIEDVFIFVRDEMHLEMEPMESVEQSQAGASATKEAAPSPSSQGAVREGASSGIPAQPGTAAGQPPAEAGKAKSRSAEAAKVSSSVRVPAERLDELMDRVGELVIAQSRLTQIAAASTDQAVRAVAEEIERLVA